MSDADRERIGALWPGMRWDVESQQAMVRTTGSWTNPDACGVDVDSIGVFVETEHEHITNFFGATRRVIAHTVMRLEPLPTDGCS